MVTFDEVEDDSTSPPPAADAAPAPPVAADEELASQSRLLDAEAIEEVAQKMTRISARMHLESLAKKLRKESEALKRVEKSKQQDSEREIECDNATVQGASAAAEKEEATDATGADEKKTDDSSSPSLPPTNSSKPKVPVVVAAGISPSAKFIPVDRFSFDAGGYNSQFVTLYVPLPGVGSIARDLVTCEFTKSSFDLIVRNLKDGKSYRLYKKDDLEHDIDDKNCKIIVKADKVIVKLAKLKKEYGGYDYWTKLTDNKKKSSSSLGSGGKENPQDSITNLMKDMYDQGDDNMKKMIGETMMKQQRGELNRPDMKSSGMGGVLGKGLGGLDDMNFDDEDF